MGVRSPEGDAPIIAGSVAREPSLRATLLLALAVFVILVANGRPIGSGDSRVSEHVAASLVTTGNLDLDEYPAVTEPFAKTAGVHRVSVYPVLTAVAAAPLFAAAKLFFVLDDTGTQLAGKWAAALFAALAAAFLYRAVARRHAEPDGRVAALVFALGTTVFATSQALWQHPAAVACLSLALVFIVRGEQREDDAWIARAALPLALCAAARHAAAPMVAVIFLGLAVRYPRRILGMVLWGLAPVLLVALYQFEYFGSPWRNAFSGGGSRFTEPFGRGHLALLFSPAKGLFVFTPVALFGLVGMVRSWRAGERWLAGTLGAALAVHVLVIGLWGEWHGGESFGPRLLTDALPLLFLFTPEGRFVSRPLFALAAAVSIGVQLLGAFAYDYRWERLYQRAGAPADRSWVWNVRDSPIPFHLREHVLIAALPMVRDQRALVAEHRFVPGSPSGSRLLFAAGSMVVSGAENNFKDAHLERGARIAGGHAELRGRWDGVFLRALPATAARRLEVRVAGRGRGILYVGVSSFRSGPPRYTAWPMAGEFLVRQPFEYAQGDDVFVTLGRGGGESSADLASVSLVPRTDAVDTIVMDGRTIR